MISPVDHINCRMVNINFKHTSELIYHSLYKLNSHISTKNKLTHNAVKIINQPTSKTLRLILCEKSLDLISPVKSSTINVNEFTMSYLEKYLEIINTSRI